MENSSKAIVIAGSVLIAILLLATGVQVYNSTGKGSAEQAKQASNQMWDGVDLNLGLAGGSIEDIEPISKEESYVGYYADLNGDKIPDGIIYADYRKKGEPLTYKDWNDQSCSLHRPGTKASEELKDYYISKTDVTGVFGNEPRDVITEVPGTTGEDRFYVMSLKDFDNGNTFCWYGAVGKGNLISSVSNQPYFTTGKTNTKNIMEAWEKPDIYGEQNSGYYRPDIWGEIKDEVENGWFVPSEEEWVAFVYDLEIYNGNVFEYGLSGVYWTSSREKRSGYSSYARTVGVYSDELSVGIMPMDGLKGTAKLRLSTTF